MDIEANDLESKDSDNLINKKEEKKNECSGKLITLIIFANIILIAIVVVIVHFVAKNKVDKISSFFNDYLKDLVKIAITPKRIEHLVKTETDDKYQIIVDLEKKMIDITWQQIKERYKETINELDKLISKFLLGKENAKGISENLVQILTQKEDYKIYQLLDEDNLKDLNQQLNEDDKRKNLEEKLKLVILYGLINFPLQMTYYPSKNSTFKSQCIDKIKEKLDPEDINLTFNNIMGNYNNISDKAVYMVLGCAQGAERSRLKSIEPFINITNVGFRVQPEDSEFNNTIKDNFDNYIFNNEIKEEIKHLIKYCFADIISDEKYENFIKETKECFQDEPLNKTKIIEIFFNYSFSIETANTVIEYLKLGLTADKIHIIQLGEDKRRLLNEPLLNYNKDEAYILYNVFDVNDANYKIGENNSIIIKRATTEANAKGLLYLQKEEPNFFTKEEFNNLILVSSHNDSERQLEAFNIIYNLNGSDTRFDSVIWNKNNEEQDSENRTIDRFIENVVKSHNLMANNLFSFNDNKDEIIKNFTEKVLNLTDTSK